MPDLSHDDIWDVRPYCALCKSYRSARTDKALRWCTDAFVAWSYRRLPVSFCASAGWIYFLLEVLKVFILTAFILLVGIVVTALPRTSAQQEEQPVAVSILPSRGVCDCSN
jgi:hypothetical protein